MREGEEERKRALGKEGKSSFGYNLVMVGDREIQNKKINVVAFDVPSQGGKETGGTREKEIII